MSVYLRRRRRQEVYPGQSGYRPAEVRKPRGPCSCREPDTREKLPGAGRIFEQGDVFRGQETFPEGMILLYCRHLTQLTLTYSALTFCVLGVVHFKESPA